MIGIDRVQIEGMRVFECSEFRPGQLSVIIGANGSGKSTLLDLFVLLSQAMGAGLVRAVSSRKGLNRILGRAKRFRIKIETTPVPSRDDVLAPLVYEFVLEPKNSDDVSYSIVKECLWQDRHGLPFVIIDRRVEEVKVHCPETEELIEPFWPTFWTKELALGQLTKHIGQPSLLRDLLGSLLHLTPGSLHLPAKSPSILRRRTVLDGRIIEDGTLPFLHLDLASFLYEVANYDGDTFEQITDVLRAGFPRFRNLTFVVKGCMIDLVWDDEHGSLSVDELSPGTLRFLKLVCTLLSPSLPKLVLLDEPETSLHPGLVRLLAELLLQASKRSQIIVATLSESLINWLEPKHMVFADVAEEGCKLTRGDQLNLDDWLNNFTMCQLWRMGIMGGQNG